MPRKTVRNKYQKLAFRKGEDRLSKEEITAYLEMADSVDSGERLQAAKRLCPCHVRTRIDDVTVALYRMLEDSDNAVRAAAWHTLEDGGVPDDPALEEIILRVDRSETDRKVRGFVDQFSPPLKRKRDRAIDLSSKPLYTRMGKCDFCGRSGVAVKQDFATEIPDGRSLRLSLICKECGG